MYQTETGYPFGEGEKHRFDFSGWARSIDERIPSLDRSLDRYFDTYMESIVEEWDLLTEYDLEALEGRLRKVGEELGRLETGQASLKERAADLESSVAELEAGR